MRFAKKNRSREEYVKELCAWEEYLTMRLQLNMIETKADLPNESDRIG